MTRALKQAVNLVAKARDVVVLTGAGASAESGVPTFRDAQTGLWERFRPEHLATEEAFRSNPAMVWTWYLWRARLVNSVKPNAGHQAIGQWQQYLANAGGRLTVATQNVDDLHERGGANDVLHLHGSLHAYRCLDCGQPVDFDPETTGIMADHEFTEETLVFPTPCGYCAAGVLRPGVVWFGEALPEAAFGTAIDALRHADLVVVVGSSGLVHPAATLPVIGQEAGASIIEINPARTTLTDRAEVYVESTGAVALPQLVEALG